MQLQRDQTTLPDVCRKLQLHALRIDVLKMGREGRLQKVKALVVRHSDFDLYANLILQSILSTERNPSSFSHTSTQKQKRQCIREQALP